MGSGTVRFITPRTLTPGMETFSLMEIVTLSDAVTALEYLFRRELLCDMCGDKLAEYKNQFHSRCAGCKSPNAQYNRNKIPNELERRIVSAVTNWCARNPPATPGDDDTDPTPAAGS